MKNYLYLEPQAIRAYKESSNEEAAMMLSIALSLKRIADSLERQGSQPVRIGADDLHAMTRRGK